MCLMMDFIRWSGRLWMRWGRQKTQLLNSLSLWSCVFLFILLVSSWQHKLLHHLHFRAYHFASWLSIAGRDNIVSAVNHCVQASIHAITESQVPRSITTWVIHTSLLKVCGRACPQVCKFSYTTLLLWRPRDTSVFGFHLSSDTWLITAGTGMRSGM